MKFVSRCEKETFDLGLALGEKLTGGDVVLLTGFLGAGKTVFSRGVAKALGVCDPILSPTFTLMYTYQAPKGLTLCHIDAYRLKGVLEAEEAGIAEVIGASDTIALVEWHENISALFTHKKTILVKIKATSQEEREVTYS